MKETNTAIAAIFPWKLAVEFLFHACFNCCCCFSSSALHILCVFDKHCKLTFIFRLQFNVCFIPSLNERQFSCVPSCLMNDEMKVFSFFSRFFCVFVFVCRSPFFLFCINWTLCYVLYLLLLSFEKKNTFRSGKPFKKSWLKFIFHFFFWKRKIDVHRKITFPRQIPQNEMVVWYEWMFLCVKDSKYSWKKINKLASKQTNKNIASVFKAIHSHLSIDKFLWIHCIRTTRIASVQACMLLAVCCVLADGDLIIGC